MIPADGAHLDRRPAMARRLIPFALGVLTLVGCRNVAGPLEARSKPKPDAPGYTIEEQERRARDKYAIPEDDWRVSPSGFIDRPSPVGR
jgi:hypothetical protein